MVDLAEKFGADAIESYRGEIDSLKGENQALRVELEALSRGPSPVVRDMEKDMENLQPTGGYKLPSERRRSLALKARQRRSVEVDERRA